MNTLETILDFIALGVQLLGSWMMFKNSPENKPNGTFISSEDPDYKTPKLKNKRLKKGFLILGIGFVLALISLTLKTFFQ